MRALLIGLMLHAACDESRPVTAGDNVDSPSSHQQPRTNIQQPNGERTMPARTHPPDVAPWARVLTRYAEGDGGFRYAELHANAEDRRKLQQYVEAVGSAEERGWSDVEALAFYVNAYNALVIAAAMEAWPTDSVMSVDGFFDQAKHRVAGRQLTLNELENDVIRADRFDEPRIHFVVNCASASCPPLAKSPYTASDLEARMEAAADAYVRSTTEVDDGTITVSRLFEWFAEDFGGDAGVRSFVAGRLDESDDAARVRQERTPLTFHNYDWSINAAE